LEQFDLSPTGFSSPMVAVETKVHPGILLLKLGMIENSNKNFVITAIKQAEKDNSLIVRGINILADAIDITLLTWRPFKHVYLVRLDEKIDQEIIITEDDVIYLQVDGHKIITLCLFD
jgi:alpha-mannosidase